MARPLALVPAIHAFLAVQVRRGCPRQSAGMTVRVFVPDRNALLKCHSNALQGSTMIKVSKIAWAGGHRLRIRFTDDSAGEYDFGPLVNEPVRWSSRCATSPISNAF